MQCNFSTASVFPTTLPDSPAQHDAHSIHSYKMNPWNVKKHVLCNSAWQRDSQSFYQDTTDSTALAKKKKKKAFGIVTTETHCKHSLDTSISHLWSVPMTPWEWELTGGCPWVHQTGSLRQNALLFFILQRSDGGLRICSSIEWISLLPVPKEERQKVCKVKYEHRLQTHM